MPMPLPSSLLKSLGWQDAALIFTAIGVIFSAGVAARNYVGLPHEVEAIKAEEDTTSHRLDRLTRVVCLDVATHHPTQITVEQCLGEGTVPLIGAVK